MMSVVQEKTLSSSVEEASPAPKAEWRGLFLPALWFGLLAGWLELGLTLAQRAIRPQVTLEMLRTNRHLLWMVPVSDVAMFGVVGLAMVLVSRLHRGVAQWLGLRLPMGMLFLALLLTIEGAYAIACVILACGLGLRVGPWLSRRVQGRGRWVRLSFAAMALGLILFTGLMYERVMSAERRALSLGPTARPGAPNVLLIVLDTVRAANLGLYGHHRATTPNLERLVRARQGLVFAEARSPASWTLPSHASMFTGRWPHELSAGSDLPLDGTFPTLAEALAARGYATAGFVGNLRYCNAAYGLNRGFARYDDCDENRAASFFEVVRSSAMGKRILQVLGYPIRREIEETAARKTAAMLNRDALGWIERQPAGRPFFVFLNYYDAHRPYVLPETPDAYYGTAALPLAEQAAIDKKFNDLDAGRSAPVGEARQRIVDEAFALYHDSYDSCIAYLDRQVGLILDELDRRGVLDNTLVIVTSDHGEELGEHALLGHSLSLYRPEVHVPLVVFPPARSSILKVVNEPVSLREVAATVAEWADLGARNPFPGRSLTRFLAGDPEGAPGESPVLCEVERMEEYAGLAHIPSSHGPIRSLVTRDRTLIHNVNGRDELYNTLSDPLESDDLALSPRSRPELDRLRDELDKQLRAPR